MPTKGPTSEVRATEKANFEILRQPISASFSTNASCCMLPFGSRDSRVTLLRVSNPTLGRGSSRVPESPGLSKS